MPSVRYFNQTAPFWDFIANLESTGTEHPFFAAYNPESRGSRAPPPPPQGPDASTQAPQHEAPPPPPEYTGPEQPHPEQPPHAPNGESFGWGFPFGGPHHGGPHHRRGPGGYRGSRGSRCGGGRGGFGGWPMGGQFDMSKLGEFISQFASDMTSDTKDTSSNTKDLTPEADVFDTEDAYVVHISLPGAKKEDVGVNWNADKSELSVAGVIYRPGDEEFLKTLALDERKVGVFERKVRLGSRASPAQVDADSISAKMEDGILVVTIPKLDREYVDVKKVDIE